jgi:hypothetical protein
MSSVPVGVTEEVTPTTPNNASSQLQQGDEEKVDIKKGSGMTMEAADRLLDSVIAKGKEAFLGALLTRLVR